jgi:hypothetical protein
MPVGAKDAASAGQETACNRVSSGGCATQACRDSITVRHSGTRENADAGRSTEDG